MPEISRFYGIVIKMYFRDHAPPHFHAEYAGAEIIVDIQSVSVIAGSLPAKATRMVLEWAAQHQGELIDLWRLAVNMQPIGLFECAFFVTVCHIPSHAG